MDFKQPSHINAEDYLAAERSALDKHEYFRGEIFAMSGASILHNIIASNLAGDLRTRLNGKRCRAFGSDLRIQIPKNTLYTYPDISIICGEIETTDDSFDTAKNPSVLIEILSKSTRDYDKGGKFTLYRDIETLQEYILVDTEKVCVEKFTRNPDNSWLLTEYKSLGGSFTISTVDITLQLADVYEDVKF